MREQGPLGSPVHQRPGGNGTSPACAGFATLILEQASTRALHSEMLFAEDARRADADAGRCGRAVPLAAEAVATRADHARSFFLRPNTSGRRGRRYAHTGIVVQADADTFKSIEGKQNDEGSAEGFEVCSRVHGYQGLDFIII